MAAGDEIAVINAGNMREYPGNPRAQVSKVERVTDKDWLLTLHGPVPAFKENDVLDNITWNPNITARNNHISVTASAPDPVPTSTSRRAPCATCIATSTTCSVSGRGISTSGVTRKSRP